ncbi:MAG: hypothetical protein ABEI31_06955 [Halodesulfurarchaeum sp.]
MRRLSHIRTAFEGCSRWDLILVTVPVAFLFTYIVGHHLLASRAVAIASATVVSGAPVVDGLFVHPPRDQRDE